MRGLARDAHRDRARPARPRRVRQAARRLLARRVRERHPRPARRARPRPRDGRRALARRRRRDAVRLPVPRAHASGSCSCRAAGSGARSTCCCAPPRCRAPSSCSRCSSPSWLGRAVDGAGWAGARLGLRARPATSARWCAASCRSATASARAAFLHTLRAVIDPGGQRVSGHDRLYLAATSRRCSSGASATRSSRPSTAAPRTRRCRAAGSSCSTASGHFPHLDDPCASSR